MTVRANRLNDWKYRVQHVQNDVAPGEFATSATTLLCIGPPTLSLATGVNAVESGYTGVSDAVADMASGAEFYPVGLVENFSLTQNKPVQRLYEIGSYRTRMVPGYTVVAASMAKVYYNGPSLLRALYAYYKDKISNTLSAIKNEGYVDAKHFEKFSLQEIDTQDSPGYNGFWMNLASDITDFPIGLLVVSYDTRKNYIGSLFLEECYIEALSTNIAANSMILMEQCNIAVTKVTPVSVNIQG